MYIGIEMGGGDVGDVCSPNAAKAIKQCHYLHAFYCTSQYVCLPNHVRAPNIIPTPKAYTTYL